MATGLVTLQRVLRAPADRIYRAFTTPDALVKFLPPHGFTAKVHELNATVGGSYKMSFTNFTTGQSHSFGGSYLELIPNERIVNTDAFDDPNLSSAMMTTSIDLRTVACGTEIRIKQEGIPELIPLENCYLGWQETLQLLALLVEAEVNQ